MSDLTGIPEDRFSSDTAQIKSYMVMHCAIPSTVWTENKKRTVRIECADMHRQVFSWGRFNFSTTLINLTFLVLWDMLFCCFFKSHYVNKPMQYTCTVISMAVKLTIFR